jgi:hypothetical protein
MRQPPLLFPAPARFFHQHRTNVVARSPDRVTFRDRRSPSRVRWGDLQSAIRKNFAVTVAFPPDREDTYPHFPSFLPNVTYMAKIPRKVAERLVAGIKRFQPILAAAKVRDVGESDTVMIVTDMLAEIFGYDKYSEITSEFAIRGTYCDLATKIDGVPQTLIEVKAIGLDLKDSHVKQAVDYAANQGIDWVLLTNGVQWRVYHVLFSKPIAQDLVIDIDFCALNPKAEADVELLFLWTKEGWSRSVIGDYHTQKQALSRFFLGAMILSDSVLDVIRRELRRVSPDVRIDTEQIKAVLENEVLKREVMEGDKAEQARKKIARSASKSLRASKATADEPAEAVQTPIAPPPIKLAKPAATAGTI